VYFCRPASWFIGFTAVGQGFRWGSLAAVLAAIPIVVLAVRAPGPLSRIFTRVSYLGYALPGIVTALALVFLGANFFPWIYQTLGMLVFAYVILFLPQVVGPMTDSLRRVHRNVEEAGYSLGSAPGRVFRIITLPLIWPGISSGMALIFLTVMKELPATLILAPTGFNTLATEVWSAVSEAFFARAAVPALILILVSSLPMAILNGITEKKVSAQAR
jgi:iron(III) transport system permease protein